MKIDIENLVEDELIDLNHKIVSRIKLMREIKTHKKMLQFIVGETVSFHPSGHGHLYGTLVRFNRKSVTIITEEGARWNVPPQLVMKAEHECETREVKNVVELFPHNNA